MDESAAIADQASMGDVFQTSCAKVKDKNKPGPAARLAAYHALVMTQQREGLYAMPCATGALP
jgi:hypothetical protein